MLAVQKNDLKDDWKPIITNAIAESVEDCNFHFRSKGLKFKNFFTDPPTEEFAPQSSCTPLYLIQILDSVQARIFIDCPNLNVNNDCEEIKNATKTCIKEKQVLGAAAILRAE